MEPVALAAYLADMYMIGKGDKGWKQVPRVYEADDRQEFFGKLRRTLKKYGYAQ
jgi:hypothetical protein